MKIAVVAAVAALAALEGPTAALAQAPEGSVFVMGPKEVNANTATIMVGEPGSTSMAVIEDMRAAASDANAMLRIIPLVGEGGPKSVMDLLYMRNVDMAIIQSDALGQFIENAPRAEYLATKLHYIARLHNMEVHLLGREGIASVADLAGRKVAVGYKGSGSDMTAHIIFEKLGVTPEYVFMPLETALRELAAGRVDAVLGIDGKPIPEWAGTSFGEAKVKFIPIPWAGALEKTYLPTKLTREDYPGLIPEGEEVESVAAMAVLTSYGWQAGTPRYRRVADFVQALFTSLPALQGEFRHPKWRGMNFASEIPGWTRFQPAGTWLEENKAGLAQAAPAPATPTPASLTDGTEAVESAAPQ